MPKKRRLDRLDRLGKMVCEVNALLESTNPDSDECPLDPHVLEDTGGCVHLSPVFLCSDEDDPYTKRMLLDNVEAYGWSLITAATLAKAKLKGKIAYSKIVKLMKANE